MSSAAAVSPLQPPRLVIVESDTSAARAVNEKVRRVRARALFHGSAMVFAQALPHAEQCKPHLQNERMTMASRYNATRRWWASRVTRP